MKVLEPSPGSSQIFVSTISFISSSGQQKKFTGEAESASKFCPSIDLHRNTSFFQHRQVFSLGSSYQKTKCIFRKTVFHYFPLLDIFNLINLSSVINIPVCRHNSILTCIIHPFKKIGFIS